MFIYGVRGTSRLMFEHREYCERKMFLEMSLFETIFYLFGKVKTAEDARKFISNCEITNKEVEELVDNRGLTLLQNAVGWKSWEVVECLLEIEGVDLEGGLVASEEYYCDTLLHLACVNYRHPEVFEHIFSRFPTPNQTNIHKETPLMFAARDMSVEVVRQLVAAGGDVFLKDEDGKTILHYAAGNINCKQLITFLLELEPSLDINARDIDGDPPLFLSLPHDSTETLQMFIEVGADLTLINKAGETVFSLAEENDNSEEIKALLSEYLPQLER